MDLREANAVSPNPPTEAPAALVPRAPGAPPDHIDGSKSASQVARAVRARAVGAVVPHDVRVAEGEKRVDVGRRMARVAPVLDEAILIVQVADRLAILQPAQSRQELVAGHRRLR